MYISISYISIHIYIYVSEVMIIRCNGFRQTEFNKLTINEASF